MRALLRAIAGLCAALDWWLAAHVQPKQRNVIVELKPPGQAQAQRPGDEGHPLVIGSPAHLPGSVWSALPAVREDVPAVVNLLSQHGFAVQPR